MPSELMKKLVEGKERLRKERAALPFSEKIPMLEKLRDHALEMKKWREEHNRKPDV